MTYLASIPTITVLKFRRFGSKPSSTASWAKDRISAAGSRICDNDIKTDILVDKEKTYCPHSLNAHGVDEDVISYSVLNTPFMASIIVLERC